MAFLLGEFLRSEPKVPKLKQVNLEAEQLAAIAANQAALPGASALAGGVNQANLDQWLKGIKFAMPEFEEQRQLVSGNITSLLGGNIPQSDLQMLQLNAASKAYGGGYSGSGMQGALTARDLGRTQLEARMQGQSALQSWMSALNTPAQMDVSSMFISPQERIGYQFKEREDSFQRDYLKNTIGAQFSAGSRFAASEDAFMKML